MPVVDSAVSAVNVLDAQSLLASFGTIGIAVVLFAETGLLIGLVLPGDSLLFTAGLLSATSTDSSIHLHIGWVLLAAAAGALIGAQVGYYIGHRSGPRLLEGKDRPRLTEGTRRTKEFLDRYGVPKAIVLARFVPVARTLINPLAGIVQVPARVFTLWQVVGGLVWSLGVTIAGWQLGSHIHNVDHYLLPIIAVIVAISLTPILLEVRRDRRARSASS
ncbi:MAG: DedA family protein [Frankiaceae bacterium]|nr:DedA family protein [Frankiaceae bacterium]MBV9872129.1 DedA family protein [Frankiaceae bacterium]